MEPGQCSWRLEQGSSLYLYFFPTQDGFPLFETVYSENMVDINILVYKGLDLVSDDSYFKKEKNTSIKKKKQLLSM
jgi:hypothetical protein